LSAGMAMPGWAYDPGTDRAPDREPLEAAKRLVPLRFNGFVPADDPAFLYGLALHDGGFFWEAHEIWEAVWKAAPMNGRDRLALRALIQIANARLKRRIERPRAAARLIDEARALLGELIARDGTSEPTSVAACLRARALREELQKGLETGLAPLALFFSSEKMKENA
jgi:predicted metal-dependent hydrolase